MGNLIEIVFEQIDATALPDFVHYFILELSSDQGDNLFLIELDGISLSPETLIVKIQTNEFESIFMNFHKFILGELKIHKPSVQIIKNENEISCSMLFNSADVTCSGGDNIIELLHAFSSKLASKFQVGAFFAGIEPALDTDTRIFTRAELGPMMII